MKKKIVILGSTGSIGKNLLNVIKKNHKTFNIKLLSTNKNTSLLIHQAKKFKVKDIIISDRNSYIYAKKKYSDLKINIHDSFSIIDKLFKKKEIYYSMISIIGIYGLLPSHQLVKYSQNIAIVNKESLVCGWNLIKKEILKFKTKFIPIDSEHFSIHSLIKTNKNSNIEKVYLTASGGPFLNYKNLRNQNITKKQALKHPNWKMGSKISVDSSTMMNKVFEVIEAKKIFNLKFENIEILSHPKSYVHAIVVFKNGLIKFLAHKPDMKIPIFNSLNINNEYLFKSENLNLKILNNLKLKKLDKLQFPLIKLIKKIPEKDSLYESIIITVNDYFVLKFLNDEIDYKKMINLIYKWCNNSKFLEFRKKRPKNVSDIYKICKYVHSKLNKLSI